MITIHSMKTAIIQMNVDIDKTKNLESMARFVKNAKNSGADIAVLPEMFNCPYSTMYFTAYAEEVGEKSYSALSKAACANGIYVVGGSIPERDGQFIYNTSFVFDRSGKEIARHRKVHLFDVDIKGKQTFFESDIFSPGDDVTVFETEFGKMGLVICFDIRFPEICRLMALKGAKAIFVPAVFNMTTGPMHWELLLRTRAVDNQIFTVGVGPARMYDSVYMSYANSMAVDPWGKVLCNAGIYENIGFANFDLREVERVRKQLPLLSALRDDVYYRNRLFEIANEDNARLQELANTDSLTGTYNRRHFTEVAEQELLRCSLDSHDFSLIMIDIDYFKEVNDRYGHSVGDDVLRIITARISHALKRNTLFARYGGDEFLIMLSDKNHEEALSVARRINKAVNHTAFSVNGIELNMSASFGVSSMDSAQQTLAELIDSADSALYKAKNMGKNTVVGFSRA